MNLIDMKKRVEDKDRKRSKLIGQKEMLLKNLKNLGFNSIEEAQKKMKEMKQDIEKMDIHYNKGKVKFQEDYGYLLQ